jgi:hypothetical protein
MTMPLSTKVGRGASSVPAGSMGIKFLAQEDREQVKTVCCLSMPLEPIMKILQERRPVTTGYHGVGPEIILRRISTPLQRDSIFFTAWRYICRLGASLEAITLLPVAAIIVMPLFLYLLVTRGYYEVLFASKERQTNRE